MKITPLNISGLFLIKPARFGDARGYFSESFRQDTFNAATGLNIHFVQDNISLSKHKNTVRGLHFQSPPFGQGKLVRCSYGSILDVAVDARQGSETYGEHYKTVLSAENGRQIWVPEGFLHGFVTLTDNCQVAYKVTDYYSKEADGNVHWNDPSLNIDWGVGEGEAIVSDKDKHAPAFEAFKSPFHV